MYKAPPAHGRPGRILHFTDSLEPSGLGEHIYLLARELGRRGYEQAVACPAVSASRALRERCAAAGLTLYPLCVRDAADTGDYQRLVRLLSLGSFDLFHNHCGITWEGSWGTFAASEAQVPVVATEHLPCMAADGPELDLKRRASRQVAATIAVSHGIARTVLEARMVPRERLHVVWNGVDVAAFAGHRSPALRRSLLGLSPSTPLIVAVGRMTPQKRHDLLLDAVALVRREVPDLVLAIAGDGPLRPELEARAARLGLTGSPGGQQGVRFLGRYPRVPELLRCVDALVQPSAFEGLPLAVLEGMAAGLPVIVTDTVGTNETVEDERSGLVVAPESATALAGAIVRLVCEAGLAQRLGVAARRRAVRHFSATMMARKTEAVYDSVLTDRRQMLGDSLLTDRWQVVDDSVVSPFITPGALTA